MKLSFFSPKTQFENVGDALINREMIKLASSNSHVFLDLSRCPEEFNETLGLDNKKTIKKVKFGFINLLLLMIFNRIKFNECFYFLSPGGYFGEVNGMDYFKRILNSLVLFSLYLIGVKICHVGVSYERLGSNFTKLIKFRSRFLHTHIVRDNMSFSYAKSIGIKVDKVSPDLAFNIFEENSVIKTKENVICFSFRVDQDPAQIELVKELVKVVDNISPVATKFVFYSQVSRDSEFMKSLSDECPVNIDRIVEFKEVIGNIDESLIFFESVDFVISNRLHVLLMSGCKSCNLIACIYKNYNTKVQGIMLPFSHDDSAVVDMNILDDVILSEFLKRNINIMDLGLEQQRQLSNDFKFIFENT